jgi:hypothetical protein
MIREAIWIAFLALFLIASTALVQIGTATKQGVFIRSGPGRNFKVIAKMRRGQQPLLERVQENWVKLAWRREAWVEKSGLFLNPGLAQSSTISGQFLRWLVRDTKVNWAFIDQKERPSLSLVVRLDSDRYGPLEDITFIANNLAESYRFHTGFRDSMEIVILKPDAQFIQDVYFQTTLK